MVICLVSRLDQVEATDQNGEGIVATGQFRKTDLVGTTGQVRRAAYLTA